jgi:NADH-quinone oxidoreductase subunit N
MLHALMQTGFPLLGLLTPPSGVEYAALIPGAIASVVAMLIVLVDTFHRPGTNRDYLAYISAVGMGVVVLSCWALWDSTLDRPVFHGMLYLDKFGLFFAALAAAAGGLALLQVPAYMQFQRMDRGEFYMLVLFSVSGAIFMANSADLLSIFIALELMSIPVYCLAGYMRRDGRGAESAMKYFVLGAFSAGLMLYGMALIYGVTGTTNLEFIGANLSRIIASGAVDMGFGVIVLGVMLILSGFAFKVAAVPFHIWTPDVYTGSPSPGVGFMSTVVKAGAFAAMLRVLFIAFEDPMLRGGFFGLGWVDVLFFLSAASMVLGNTVAIMQDNIKRMLAYSSIAHAGYILLGIAAAGARPEFFLLNDAVLFYLVTYTFGTVGAFGVLSYLGRKGTTVETYEDVSGLGLKYPFAGLMMGVFMFSSAGIPPTAGFVGKLYVFRAAVDVGVQTGEFAFIGLSVLAVITSVAGAYYYLRVLVCMYMREPVRDDWTEAAESKSSRLSMGVCAALTLLLGVMPATALELSREGIVDFQGAPASIRALQKQGGEQLEKMREDAERSRQPAAEGEAPQG